MLLSFLQAALKIDLKSFHASSGKKRAEKHKHMPRVSAHGEPPVGKAKMCRQSCEQLAVNTNRT